MSDDVTTLRPLYGDGSTTPSRETLDYREGRADRHLFLPGGATVRTDMTVKEQRREYLATRLRYFVHQTDRQESGPAFVAVKVSEGVYADFVRAAQPTPRQLQAYLTTGTLVYAEVGAW